MKLLEHKNHKLYPNYIQIEYANNHLDYICLNK